MCEILIKLNCPHCQSRKIVKNGRKKNGNQNLLCQGCGKQFVATYQNKGANPAVKRLIVGLLERNSGIRDIENILQISRRCVLHTLLQRGKSLRIRPEQDHYRSIQIDEVWSYVGQRKKGKYWLLYAYSAEHDQIIAYSCGSRSAKTVRALINKLQGVTIDEYCTDHWKSFTKVLPAQKHRIGKEFTKNIEGVNTCLRARNRRLVRKTTCFSKNKEYHEASLNIMFHHRNEIKLNHHTF